MAETKGMLKTCDRCGETVFIKRLPTREIEEFEKTPEGWEWRTDTKLLCPKCSETYRSIVKDFMTRSNFTVC